MVLTPIRDSTGQSVHVDGYLGNANSADRQAASHLLNRIAKKMGEMPVPISPRINGKRDSDPTMTDPCIEARDELERI